MPDHAFDRYFDELPVIVTLRGILPEACRAIGEALVGAGIRLLEVPLNAPDPLASIRALSDALAGRALVGAAAVYRAEDVDAVADAGGRMIGAPNTNPDVIEQTLARELVAMPGCFTASEAVVALVAGADALRLFPGELVTIESAKALADALPTRTRFLLDGGVSADTVVYWRDTALSGFVIGHSLYEPGLDPQDAALRAADLVSTFRS